MQEPINRKRIYSLLRSIERPSNLKDCRISFGKTKFTRTQVKVLERIGEGYSNPEIADILCLSRRTVETHIFKIRQTLQEFFGYKFCDRELVIFARRMLDDYRKYIKDHIQEFTKKYLLEETRSNDHIIEDIETIKRKYKLISEMKCGMKSVSPRVDQVARCANY